MIIGDDLVPQQTEHASQALAKNCRAYMADMHWFGGVRRTEINHDGARLLRFFEEQMFAASCEFHRIGHGGRLQPEIQKAGPRYFHLFAPIADIEFGEDIGRNLPRIQFPSLGQRHQGVALVITELWVRTGADENGGKVCIRQYCGYGFAKSLLD